MTPAEVGIGAMEFAEVRQPLVSIVICAHDQFAVTLACLRALQDTERWNATSFEIVLVDDASTDAVPTLAAIPGLSYRRLEPNRGFLRAANVGLAAVRGRHVLFLNNDTLPQGTWLDEMIGTLERRPKAGLVGARLVFPDGRIQEAGGIVFSNGAAWNYGRSFDPDDPRVTFEREVDYCSGAALLVRDEVLRTLHGFDERFVPAYYEDADLCFAAREQGWQVWYQPAAIVVHFEGTSHGVDPTAGTKAHQVTNGETFRRKWAAALTRQFPPEAHCVPLARRRSTAGHVLVIDNEVPTPDRDAGSRRLIAVLTGMLDLGYGVTYLPFNGWRRPGYTKALERLGVEVLGRGTEMWSFVSEMAAGLTHAWVCRPHVAEALLSRLRADFPHLRLVYDTIDLHFLREERGAALQDSASLATRAADTRRVELAIADTADAVVVVSPYEREVLVEHTRSPVYVVPIAHDVAPARRHAPASHDILFVGGFRHPPNADAVEWFVATVLPRVRAAAPAARLLVVGAHAPEPVRALQSDGVEILGWVPDLEPLYRRVRLVVAPLRYGAGVKGKVGEALAQGVPTVMTSIAAEGMNVDDGVHGIVTDDPETMAAHIVRLLADDVAWHALSQSGRTLVTERCSPEAVRPLLDAVLRGAAEARP